MSELPIDQILCGDVVELAKEFPDDSIHAIVTDPPYGLEFMGEEWDSNFNVSQSPDKTGRGSWIFGDTPSSQSRPSYKGKLFDYHQWTTLWAEEALRILKPGASMLVMGGTRTYHRMACGVEDAGFQIKDCLAWCYNSGFPKAQVLGKMIDKRLGSEREIIGLNPNVKGRTRPDSVTKCLGAGKDATLTAPASDLAKKWNGWKVGTLKPAFEPILWAVKPPEGSYIDNVLKHGVGAINVDGCRIPFEDENDGKWESTPGKGTKGQPPKGTTGIYGYYGNDAKIKDNIRYESKGRYPANMIRTDRFYDGHDRFYFVPKASRAERDKGLEGMSRKFLATMGDGIGAREHNPKEANAYVKNIHPTVKPVALMEHLIRLITRKGQIVLDPFVGSGTTCIAARRLNRRYIGFDNNPEYVEIAKHRLSTIPKPLVVCDYENQRFTSEEVVR